MRNDTFLRFNFVARHMKDDDLLLAGAIVVGAFILAPRLSEQASETARKQVSTGASALGKEIGTAIPQIAAATTEGAVSGFVGESYKAGVAAGEAVKAAVVSPTADILRDFQVGADITARQTVAGLEGRLISVQNPNNTTGVKIQTQAEAYPGYERGDVLDTLRLGWNVSPLGGLWAMR